MRKRSWLKWAAVLIALVLIAGGLLVGIPQVFPPPPPKPPPTPAERAQGVVEQFYNDINSWNYQAAYKLLKTNPPDGYHRFVNAYEVTEHDDVTYRGVTQLTDGTFKVAITIVATELRPEGTVKTTYVVDDEIVEPGTWLIKDEGRLNKIGTPVPALPTSSDPIPSSDPIQQAQAVVKRFHNDINMHNYPDAYSQWGADFHKFHSYWIFVNEYSRTQHESVNITNTAQFSDGTVQVTADATEETDSGMVMRNYRHTYIVGQENEAWRIISDTPAASP